MRLKPYQKATPKSPALNRLAVRRALAEAAAQYNVRFQFLPVPGCPPTVIARTVDDRAFVRRTLPSARIPAFLRRIARQAASGRRSNQRPDAGFLIPDAVLFSDALVIDQLVRPAANEGATLRTSFGPSNRHYLDFDQTPLPPPMPPEST